MKSENTVALGTRFQPAYEAEKHGAAPPLIAVIIPVYKQAPYLKDAVITAINQSLCSQTKVIIVNDGCPHPSTDWLGRFFSDALSGTVYYLKKTNGGLSSARNWGIRFALDAWPSIQAVFPLDADNRLSPTTLERLWQKLATSEPDVGWVYQDLTFFGIEDRIWCTGLPFSLFRLVHQNYCDAGSLIHRRVFEAGVWYDEEMKSGYEDWEFFVHAALRRFRGVHAANTGFLYRRHGHSMLKDAQARHETIYSYIRTKHRERLKQNDLAFLEHSEMPRFALIVPGAGKVTLFTVHGLPTAQDVDLSTFVDALAAGTTTTLDAPYVPPITIFARRELLDFLHGLRLLPGLLFTLQKKVARNGFALANLDVADDPYVIDVEGAPSSGELILFAISSRKLVEVSRKGRSITSELVARQEQSATQFLKVGEAFFGGDQKRLLTSAGSEREAALRHAVDEVAAKLSSVCSTAPAARVAPKREDDLLSHADFAAWAHLDHGWSVFPHCSRREALARRQTSIFFAVPWLGLGGVDQCVLNLARELSNLNPAYSIHLVITESSRTEIHPNSLTAFDTIRWLPLNVSKSEKERVLVHALGEADVIINAHSPLCYQMLPELRNKCNASLVSYLHVVDLDAHGVPCGYPVIASREYARLIDHFVVISEHLRRFCLNLGIPEEKVLVLPNAATVSPASADAALRIAEEKCRRSYSRERPIEILFCGRFDRQKGIDRLQRIAAELTAFGLPFEMRLMGKPVLSSGLRPSSDIPGVRVLPAEIDRDVLARYYQNADVFLLPSRWEGIPLTALEAMSFGNVVIATRVGAINEIVESGKSGFLIEATQEEENLVRQCCKIITDIVDDPRRYDEIRLAACTRAMEWSWARSAERLARLIDEVASRISWS